MNRSLEGIKEVLVAQFGECAEEDAGRIDRIFAAHPDFCFNIMADGRLRTELYAEIERLTKGNGLLTISLGDDVIRNQTGVPRLEEDMGWAYDNCFGRTGDILLLEDQVTEISVVGPCPASTLRWAVVERCGDKERQLISWQELIKLPVIRRGDVRSAREEQAG